MAEYSYADIEKKWQNYWAEHKTFTVENPKPGQKKYYILDMFPYPSGSGLHLGHPVGYTATDIYSRFKRMQGYAVLHPMGWDAFGLPAEQHAINTGEHPSLITEKNCARFKEQMDSIGLSFDWSREIYTCRADYYRWTQWIFLKLYNSWFDDEQQKARPIEELEIPAEIKAQGILAIQKFQSEHRLAYYADAMVNWCPALGTVLANEEVIDGKSERGGFDVIRKPMKQWILRITKYSERLVSELEDIDWPESIKEQQRNWVGKKYGAEISFALAPVAGAKAPQNKSVVAFTTRPDTLFGVTFFVLAPEHALVDALTSNEQRAKVEKYREEAKKLNDMTRTMENRKKTGVFTGGYVVNPITNEEVPVFVGDYVLSTVGTGAVMGVPAHDERDFEFARTFNVPVRPVLVPQNSELALVQSILDGETSWTEAGVMIAQKFPVALELKLEGLDNSEAGTRICAWLSERNLGKRVVNYKLRDWLFSRQRYWGEPIPIIHWEDGTVTPLTEADLPLTLPEVAEYKPSESGESPLSRAGDWLTVVDPITGKKGRRETNTMPQWAGSCWYYLRFADANNKTQAWSSEIEKAWLPVDLYVGGAEHAVLHLLYSRFWHKVLYDLGFVSTKEPFKKLVNQGMLLAYAYKDARGALIPVDQVTEDENGVPYKNDTKEKLERIVAKMSKSLKNVVTPDEIIEQYGADTLRLYIMFMGPIDASRIYDAKAIIGIQRFLRRAWTLVTQNSDSGVRECVSRSEEPKEMTRAINVAIKRVTEDLDGMRFNTAISALMEYGNAVGDKKLALESIRDFVLLLAPLAPHLAEELWARLGNTTSLATHPFPTYDPVLLAVDQVTVVVQVNGKKRVLLEVAPSIDEAQLKALVIERLASTEYKVSESDKFITVRQPGTGAPKLVNVLMGT